MNTEGRNKLKQEEKVTVNSSYEAHSCCSFFIPVPLFLSCCTIFCLAFSKSMHRLPAAWLAVALQHVVRWQPSFSVAAYCTDSESRHKPHYPISGLTSNVPEPFPFYCPFFCAAWGICSAEGGHVQPVS